jgi:hypothetical protein
MARSTGLGPAQKRHGSAAAAATAAPRMPQVGEQVPRAVLLEARQAAAHVQLRGFRQRAAAAGVNMGQQQPEVHATLVSSSSHMPHTPPHWLNPRRLAQ